jgi:hypothetical protein
MIVWRVGWMFVEDVRVSDMNLCLVEGITNIFGGFELPTPRRNSWHIYINFIILIALCTILLSASLNLQKRLFIKVL